MSFKHGIAACRYVYFQRYNKHSQQNQNHQKYTKIAFSKTILVLNMIQSEYSQNLKNANLSTKTITARNDQIYIVHVKEPSQKET